MTRYLELKCSRKDPLTNVEGSMLRRSDMAYTFLPFLFNERSTRFSISDGEIDSAPARLKSVRKDGLFSPLSRIPM